MNDKLHAKQWAMGAVFGTVVAFGVAGCAAGGKTWGDEEAGEAFPEGDVEAAIDDARRAVAFAKARHWIWKSTEGILEQAEEAAAEGKDDKAMQLAGTAERQAELATNQYYLEQAKMMLQEWENYGMLGDKDKKTVKKLREAIRMGEGAEAYSLAKQMS